MKRFTNEFELENLAKQLERVNKTVATLKKQPGIAKKRAHCESADHGSDGPDATDSGDEGSSAAKPPKRCGLKLSNIKDSGNGKPP